MKSCAFRMCLLLSTALVLGSAAFAQAPRIPRSDVVPGPISLLGVPLKAALKDLGDAARVRLQPARELAEQRVTLILRDRPLDQTTQYLADLLSASDTAPVSWRRDPEGIWRLHDSIARRKLAEDLDRRDLEAYTEHLEKQIAWARTEGPQAVAAATSPEMRQGYVQRLAHASFLDSLGAEKRKQLLEGTPIVMRVGDLPDAQRRLFREVLGKQVRVGRPDEELDRFSYVYLMARDPFDARGHHLLVSVVMPQGGTGLRHGLFGVPNPRVDPGSLGVMELPTPRATDTSRRVTLSLASPTSKEPYLDRNLDEVLAALSRDGSLDVVADGYLRSPMRFPGNIQIRDYPLDTLLDWICRFWECNWRYADAEKKVLLIRSKSWWHEDATNVPEEVVADFRTAFGPDHQPGLRDLLRLSHLTRGQIHKLVEAGICPAAEGLVRRGWYDEASPALPWLRVFDELPSALQARVQSPEGLPLSELPAGLLDRHLAVPLIAGVGVLSRAEQAQTRFRLQSPGPGSVLAEINVVQPDGAVWRRSVQAPRKPR